MCYEVIVTPHFKKDAEYYFRKKKYTKIYEDINDVVEKLKKGDLIGDVINDLQLHNRNDTYKVRSVNSSINVGASNGFRIIYHVIKNEKEIYLVTVYSKKDDDKILSKKELAELIRSILQLHNLDI